MEPAIGIEPITYAFWFVYVTILPGLALYHIISDLGRSYKVSTLAQDYTSLLARDFLGASPF